MSTEYTKYQHVEKLGHTEVDGINIGKCYIFPKIDGTNAQVWKTEDGIIHYGSRRRELTEGNDNAGFKDWASSSSKLKAMLDIFEPGTRIFGEWLVPHTIKTYRESAWNKFYIFDIICPNGYHMHFDTYEPVLKQVEYQDYLTPIRIINNPTDDDIQKVCNENTYLIDESGQLGEGVVVKNYDFENKYGRTIWAKVVTSTFKEDHSRAMGAPESNGTAYIEEKIARHFIDTNLIDKVIANITLDKGEFNSKDINRLLHTVFYDLIREHSWDFVKKYKNPKIDFKILFKFSTLRIKELKPNLF